MTDAAYIQSVEKRLAQLQALVGRLARAAQTGGLGAVDLDDLTDVVLTATAAGDVLKFDGSQWVDGLLTDANVAAANKDGAVGTASMRTLGTGAAQAAQGSALAAKADLASPTFTGVPAAPTAALGTDTTQLATMAALQTALGNPSSARPAVRAYNSANQSIATGTDTAVILNTERYDLEPTGMHDNATNNTRLTCVTPGVYDIVGHANFDINATGWRSVMIRLNGTTVIAEDREIAAAGIEQRIAISTHYQLAAGDYIEIVVRQSSGGALNLVATGNYGAEAAMAYIGASTSAWGNAAAKAYRSAALSPANVTLTAIGLDAEEYDLDSEHDNVTNNTRLTCVTPGLYRVTGQITWVANATGTRATILRKNGATTVARGEIQTLATAAETPGATASTTVQLAAGDYIELMGYQSSGGALALQTGAGEVFLCMERVGYQTNPNTPPSTRVRNSAAISAANSANTALTFDTERHDNAAIHSTSSNTGRLTAPIAGVYDIGANILWAANTTGVRYLSLVVNGGTFIDTVSTPAQNPGDVYQSAGTQYKLAAGDYVEVIVNQTSGGALNVTATPSQSAEFYMTRISDG